jgi:hypothetical protein
LIQSEVGAPQEPTVPPTLSEVEADDVPVTPTSTPLSPTPEPTHETALVLSTELVSGCERQDGSDPNLREGDLAVDFSLMDVGGNTFVLSDLLKDKPVALIYGSFT